MSYELIKGDCFEIMRRWEPDTFDLVFFSPPYEDCRTYGIDFDLAGQEWVDWMVQVFTEAQRVCKGLVACVCQGRTSDYRWSAVPALLIADLHRAGLNLRNPPIFHRVGIPGSGGPDWLRGDYEWIVCTSKPGKLPWSDNTACGHTPKWAPGGKLSYRNKEGVRRNLIRGTSGYKNGDIVYHKQLDRAITEIVNPGNSIEQTYTAAQVAKMLQLEADYRHHIVGGGLMGEQSEIASKSEAPFPEDLVSLFVRSFCPEGGRVLDPFSGSGTTVAVAHRWKRHGIGIDIRQSQIELATKRLLCETPLMFV